MLYVLARTSCPRGFERLGNSSIGFGCYSFSRERVGWIEAKKICELNGANLITLESIEESEAVLENLLSSTRRRSRFEYWTAGNDIDRENRWEWAGTKEIVPDFGWLDQPLPSAEENCLTWSITIESRYVGMWRLHLPVIYVSALLLNIAWSITLI